MRAHGRGVSRPFRRVLGGSGGTRRRRPGGSGTTEANWRAGAGDGEVRGRTSGTATERAHQRERQRLRAAPVRQSRATYTETGWEVFAQGLTDMLLRVKERYGSVPMYVTENGAAFFDPPTAEDERIQDPLRVSYLRKHIAAVHAALDAGVDMRGYFLWSLMDNMEWSLGYSKRFGIVHVDFGTLKRTPKDSARFYSKVIASNGGVLNEAP